MLLTTGFLIPNVGCYRSESESYASKHWECLLVEKAFENRRKSQPAASFV
jgi:hypothetical protein